MQVLRFFLITFIIGMSPALSAQCMLVEAPLDMMTSAAHLIVEGKVIGQESFWDDDRKLIYTAHKIEVFKTLKGNVPDTEIEIITLGGKVGEMIIKAEPSLELSMHEIGIFFLKHNHVKQAGRRSNFMVFEPLANAQSAFKYDFVERKAIGVFKSYNLESNELTAAISTQPEAQLIEHKPFNPLNEIRKYEKSGARSISSFSPTTITAGTFSVLTISGSGFGSVKHRVRFKDADNGGSGWIDADALEILSWTDTQIEVQVPKQAGSGQVRVITSGGTTFTSANDLTIRFAEYAFKIPGDSLVRQTQYWIPDTNATGRTIWFYLSNSMFNNGPANAAFHRAIERWRCATGVNWRQAAGPALPFQDTTAFDGLSVVRWQNLSPFGPLAQQITFLGVTCPAGPDNWLIRELDIVFNSYHTWTYGATPGPLEVDFESVAIHELGHAQQLGHVIAPNKIMHYSFSFGTVFHVLHPDEIEGGQNVVQRSASTPINCVGTYTMEEFSGVDISSGGAIASGPIYVNASSDFCLPVENGELTINNYLSGIFFIGPSCGSESYDTAYEWQYSLDTGTTWQVFNLNGPVRSPEFTDQQISGLLAIAGQSWIKVLFRRKLIGYSIDLDTTVVDFGYSNVAEVQLIDFPIIDHGFPDGGQSFFYTDCDPPFTLGTEPVSGGDGTYTYQWFENSGSGWNPIPGATQKSHTPIIPIPETRSYYRRVATGHAFFEGQDSCIRNSGSYTFNYQAVPTVHYVQNKTRQAIQDAIDAACENLPMVDIEFLWSYTASSPGPNGNNNRAIIDVPIHINKNVRLNGPVLTGANETVYGYLDGEGLSQIFVIDSGYTVEINNFNIINGNSTGDGGAIHCEGQLTLDNVNINNSTAAGNGGGIYNGGCGQLSITNSTIANNLATKGAGVYSKDSVGLNNCTVYNNNASQDGGGLYGETDIALQNTTIDSNSATSAGGGFVLDPNGIFYMNNVLLAENSAATGADGYYSGPGNLTGSYNLISDTTGMRFIGGSSNILGNTANPIDAKLGPLALNGAQTETVALRCSSPAIDAGNPSAPITDQRAQPRFGTPDIGAYERQESDLSGTVYTVTDKGDGLADNMLRGIVALACANDTIRFDSALEGDTIKISGSHILLDKNLVIEGLGADKLFLQNISPDNRIFWITALDTIQLSGAHLMDGQVTGSGGADNGGAIRNQGKLILDKCTFSNNSSQKNAGAIYSQGSNSAIEVSNCAFFDNSSAESGGALWNGSRPMTVYNTTFSGNSSADGGAVRMQGTTSFYNNTLYQNSATRGGGIFLTGGNAAITANIIAGNSGDDVFINSGNFNSGGHNLIGDTTGISAVVDPNDLAGNNANPLDPKLLPLANHGGSTPTHAMRCNSPAIDAGIDPALITTDQRGESKDGVRDIGAFEKTTIDEFGKVLTVLNNNDAGTGSLRELILGSCPYDTIIFDIGAPGLSIALDSHLLISHDLAIIGPGADLLTLDGQNVTQIIRSTSATGFHEVLISGLRLVNGAAAIGGPFIGQSGGAIYNFSLLTIEDCDFENNTASDPANGTGGAVMAVRNTIMRHCNFNNNSAIGGGAVFGQGATIIEDCNFSSNTVVDTFGTFSYVGHGAAYFGYNLADTVRRSTFRGNDGAGAAVSVSSSSGCVENNTISGNLSGGVRIGADVTFLNNTVYNNSGGDGLNLFGSHTLGDNLIAANPAGDIGISGGTLTSLGYNFIGNGQNVSGSLDANDQWGTNANPLDPFVLPLADNGGFGHTHKLDCASPLYNAAHPTTTGTDQRGVPIFDGRRDIGSYESERGLAGHQLVTTVVDDGPGSFRYMVAEACPGDTITFGPATDAIPIVLDQGGFVTPTNQVVIIGRGSDGGTLLDGAGSHRVIDMRAGDTATMTDLAIQNGTGNSRGTGIANSGVLTLERITIENNTSSIEGAGLRNYGSGTCIIKSATFRNNFAPNFKQLVNEDNAVLDLHNVYFDSPDDGIPQLRNKENGFIRVLGNTSVVQD